MDASDSPSAEESDTLSPKKDIPEPESSAKQIEADVWARVTNLRTEETREAVTEVSKSYTKKGKPLFVNEEEKSDVGIGKKNADKMGFLFDSPESDKDDLWKTHAVKKEDSQASKKPLKSKVVTGDLFADDDGLFGSRKPLTNVDNSASSNFKSDIFDDDEDGDDIFSTKKLKPKTDLMKKSLFDDDEDEGDIFGASSTVSVSKRVGE